jgi:hypothetical protein
MSRSTSPSTRQLLMDRRRACQIQANLCRVRASMDTKHRKLWMTQAVIWEGRASEEVTLTITIDQAPRKNQDTGSRSEPVF